MLAPGDRIGDWIVDERIGEGGMGAVYRCHASLSDAMKAAIKVLKAKEVAQGRERFVQELKTLASLGHPGIVRVLGGGEDRERDLLYLVMELVSGEPLSARLVKGPIPPAEAVELARRLAECLAYAHENGVFHRDVKPSNVMLAPGGAKLIDFGIARAASREKLTMAGTVTGTLAYLPPESFQVDEPDPAAADVYALGLTLHEALTAAHPFGDDTTSSASLGRLVAAKLSTGALDPGAAFGRDLRELVLRATHPDPAQRVPSMAAFAEALGGLGIAAPAPAGPAKPPMTVSARKSADLPPELLAAVKPPPGAKPPPMAPPKVADPAPEGGGGRGAMLAVGGLLVVAGLLAVGTLALVGAGGLALWSSAPDDRVVHVVVEGTADVVRLAGQDLVERDGDALVAKLRPDTTAVLVAASGPGAAGFVGGTCPACTVCAEREVRVEAGDGPQVVRLGLGALPAVARDLAVSAPNVPEPGRVSFVLDGAAVVGERASAVVPAVAGGAHVLVARTGDCAPTETCTEPSACGAGCTAVKVDLDVVCGEGQQVVAVPLVPPGAPPAPVPVAPEPTRPVPAPVPAPVEIPEPEPEPAPEPAVEPEPEPEPAAQRVTVRVLAPAATAGLLVRDGTGEVQQVSTNQDVTVEVGTVVVQHGYGGPPVAVEIGPGSKRIVCGTIDACSVK